MHAFAYLCDQTEHVGTGGVACIHEKISVPIADPRVADGKSLERQLIDHPSGRPAWRILKNASGAFLVERLAAAAFFVADANAFDDFAIWLGGELQFHREHNIIRCK